MSTLCLALLQWPGRVCTYPYWLISLSVYPEVTKDTLSFNRAVFVPLLNLFLNTASLLMAVLYGDKEIALFKCFKITWAQNIVSYQHFFQNLKRSAFSHPDLSRFPLFLNGESSWAWCQCAVLKYLGILNKWIPLFIIRSSISIGTVDRCWLEFSLYSFEWVP